MKNRIWYVFLILIFSCASSAQIAQYIPFAFWKKSSPVAPAPAPSYVDHTSDLKFSGTTWTIAKPTGLAVNDLMIAHFVRDSNSNMTPPSGWTLLVRNDETGWGMIVFYKFADAADVAATDFTFTQATTIGQGLGIIAAYTDVSTTTPFDFVTTRASGSGTNIYVGGTTTNNNVLMVAVGDASSNLGTPTGYTSREYDFGWETRLADKVEATAGTISDISTTGNAAWLTFLAALNPTDATDPCASSPTMGDVCMGGTIYAGTYQGDGYMITPGNCNGEVYAACDWTADSATKAWFGGTGSNADISTVANVTLAATPSLTSERGYVTTPRITADPSVSSTSAADYCQDLIYGGYSDWYLPSKSELAYIYCKASPTASHSVGNPNEDPNCTGFGGKTYDLPDFAAGYYWAATENSSTNAWYVYFDDGWQAGAAKSSFYNYRCVRRFNRTTPDSFDFLDVYGAATSTVYEVAATLSGLDLSSTASVTGGDAQIRKNNTGAWGSSVSVNNGDIINLRMTSSASASTGITATVTVGTFSADWVVDTSAGAEFNYFVAMSANVANGNLGGLSGANATCLSDLQANDWMGKSNVVLDSSTVKAFLCDDSTCQNTQASKSYAFALSGTPAFGGDTFTTDGSGLGPGDANTWRVDTKFGLTTTLNYFTGRASTSASLWANTPDANTCNNWTDGTAGYNGRRGSSNASNANRWTHGTLTACNVATRRLICLVDYTQGIDDKPDAFDFTDVTSAALNTEYSDSVVIMGFVGPQTASVTGGGAEIRANNTGSWVTSGLAVNPGDTLNIRMTSASGGQSTVTATVTVGSSTADWSIQTLYLAPADCPVGYVGVPADGVYSTYGFCVMKYEAKAETNAGGSYDADGLGVVLANYKPASVATNVPWRDITRDEALSECQSLGSGYDLISNAQWQTIARNIENQNANWTGATVGSGCLFQGNNGETNCGFNGGGMTASGSNARAIFALSTGGSIYDFAGNVWEWLSDTNTTNYGAAAYINTITSGTHTTTGTLDDGVPRAARDQFGPLGSYPSSNNNSGLGYGWLDSNQGLVRGGGYGNNDATGVFSVSNWDDPTTTAVNYVGFRCVYNSITGGYDPYAANVVLLVQPDADDVSIVDYSTSAHTVTPVDNAALSTAIADPWGGNRKIVAFDGADDSLSLADSDDWYLNGDFTVDLWVYHNNLIGTTTEAFIQQYEDGSNNWTLFLDNDATEGLGLVVNGSYWFTEGSPRTDINGSWAHIALVRQGNVFSMYRNGVLVNQDTNAAAFNNNAAALTIGNDGSNVWDVDGYMTSIRITKGIARYTENFAPSAQPFHVSDVVPDAFTLIDFWDSSSLQSISGINTPITLRFNAANGTGAPTFEYNKNGSGWTAWTTLSDADVSFSDGDSVQFRVSGTVGDTGTITITNLDNGNATLATIVGTVPADPCDFSPPLGTTCANGTIYAGVFDGGKYMVTPSGCTDSSAPACTGGTDSLTKKWRGTGGSDSDIPGITNIANLTDPSPDSERGHVVTPIITVHSSIDADSAADYCNDMIYGGYDDWYLPSKSEMAYLYCHGNANSHSTSYPNEDINCVSQGGKTSELTGFDDSAWYWTSTENAAGFSWQQSFFDGGQGTPAKNADARVRCVRRYGADTSDGLIHHWTLDETSGTNAPDSVGSLDGTLTNSPTWSPGVGIFDGSLTFSGNTDYVAVPNTGGVFTTAPLSWSVWVKLDQLPSSAGANKNFVHMAHSSAPWAAYELWADDTGDLFKWSVINSGGTAQTAIADSALVANQWYHVVGTIDASYNTKLYINGVQQTSTGSPGSLYAANSNLRIGGISAANQSHDGPLDDARFYNKALTASEISDLYHQGISQYAQYGNSPSDCPAGYIGVPSDGVYTSEGFCVMKYEAKAETNAGGSYDADGLSVVLANYKPASVAANVPWRDIDRDEALSECQSLGTGYNLISNAQWQTLARNIEQVDSNWTGGTVGSGCLFQGNNGETTCGFDGANPDASSSNSRGIHTLSTGGQVHDLAGNIYEWVRDDNATNYGSDAYYSNITYATHTTTGTLDDGIARAAKDQFGPAGSYSTSNNNSGLGIGYLNASAGAVRRGGGDFAETGDAGIFYVALTDASTVNDPGYGFRCVYEPSIGGSDPYAANVVLLVQPDADDSTIVDYSASAHTVTPQADAALSTSVADPWGGVSKVISFDGTGDYLSIPDSNDWYFATGDFTLEAWVYINSLDASSQYMLIGQEEDGSNYHYTGLDNGSNIGLSYGHGGTGTFTMDEAGDRLTPVGQWFHYAVVRSGNNFYSYVNGTEIWNDTTAAAIDDHAAELQIGAFAGLDNLNGYMTGVRITKGVARYTAEFSPPSVAFAIPDLCDGTPAIGSTCLGGAIYAGQFDGGKYMIVPSGCNDSPNPTCPGTGDTLTKSFDGSGTNTTNLAGVETVAAAATKSSSSYRGDVNTAAMVAEAPSIIGTDSIAHYCNEMNFGGYSDWYVPSKSELAYLYCKASVPSHSSSKPEEEPDCTGYGGKTSDLTGSSGFVSGGSYYSSTERGAQNVWYIWFSNGSLFSTANKDLSIYIRCIRRY